MLWHQTSCRELHNKSKKSLSCLYSNNKKKKKQSDTEHANIYCMMSTQLTGLKLLPETSRCFVLFTLVCEAQWKIHQCFVITSFMIILNEDASVDSHSRWLRLLGVQEWPTVCARVHGDVSMDDVKCFFDNVRFCFGPSSSLSGGGVQS